jgi:large subunit ribosomal protein L30
MEQQVKVTQVRSSIGVIPNHRKILKALGLGRIGKARTHKKGPVLDGMVRKVGYLIKVEKV